MFNLDRRTVNLLHMVVIGPLLAYVGYMGMRGEAIPENLFKVLLAVGVLAALYHGSKYMGLMENMVVQGKQREEEIVRAQ